MALVVLRGSLVSFPHGVFVLLSEQKRARRLIVEHDATLIHIGFESFLLRANVGDIVEAARRDQLAHGVLDR